MSPRAAETTLKWLLLGLGVLTCLALVAVFLPTSWMEAGAEAAGFGEFPDVLLVQYLARSVSLIYALLGALCVYVALDVGRYLALVRFIGWLVVGLGVGLFGIDRTIGMPAAITWGEGPPTVLIGVAFVWLAGRAAAGRSDQKS